MSDSVRIKDIVRPNDAFSSSINIDFDFGSVDKTAALIPTDSVRRCFEELLRDVIMPSTDRAKLLVGAYGKGKSHVVLAALHAMWHKDVEPFRSLIDAYREQGSGFAETLEQFVAEGKRLLPVRIVGSSSDLRHSFLFALRNALNSTDLGDLMPETDYDGALRVLDRWERSYPATLERFEELTGESATSIASRLKAMDTRAYETFVEAYPELTSGSAFEVLDDAEVLSVYEHVLGGLRSRGISGIYVVYDEFGKYLEANLDRSTFKETKLLQDFAEACARSGQEEQLHLLLISHKSLANYIDANIPKEKADGWRGVSGRFREIEMSDDPHQYYRLLEKAIIKEPQAWHRWLDSRSAAHRSLLERVANRYAKRGLLDADDAMEVTLGCFPLHPTTAFLLAATSEKIAQNERTLFTFVCSHEPNALASVIENVDGFVAPDCIYDYFEPVLRKEFYSSPLHKIYELVRLAMERVAPTSLEGRIVKTVALIDIVSQYGLLSPTVETIVEIYGDCGFGREDVHEAIDRLIKEESVIYLRKSNAFLRLKETSGVRIDEELEDRASMLRDRMRCSEILNGSLREVALYPSRYNEEKGMVRYFDCGFVDATDLVSWHAGEPLIESDGDGQVIGVHVNSPDELQAAKTLARDMVSNEAMTIAVFPRHYKDMNGTIYRFEAARQLKEENADDPVLSEEYQIVIDDLGETIDDYIAGFFQPELGRSLYYVAGHQKKVITRRRKLSEQLSELCDETYENTPKITSEALNKNEITGTAFGSRSKIIKALCGKALEPNFGFVGNGQETSMARSAFKATGILPDFEHSTAEGEKLGREMANVLDEISNFIKTAQATPFSVLFDRLTGRELGIGMRRGPIPVYLAYELRKYRDEILITHLGQERPFDVEVIDDLSKNPENYELTQVNWTPEMGDFLTKLGELFGCESEKPDKSEVVAAMRLWYANLPQMTRNSRVDHSSGNESTSLPKRRAEFFKAIRQLERNSDAVLFEDIPRAFRAEVGSAELFERIEDEKQRCDAFLGRTIDALAMTLKGMFSEEHHEDASLSSVIQDWFESHPATSTHAFGGSTQRLLEAAQRGSGSDRAIVDRLARAATSLRIQDWNDARFGDFLDAVSTTLNEVERYSLADDEVSDADTLGIISIDDDGVVHRKTFDRVSTSRRSELLRSSILACLDDMGGSLGLEEKRQIVFEVLEGLC